MSECCAVVAPPAGRPIISVSNGLSYEPLLDRLVKPIKMHVAKLSDGGHPVCQHFCRLISLRKDSTQPHCTTRTTRRAVLSFNTEIAW